MVQLFTLRALVRKLRREPGRTMLSIVAIAAAMALVLVFEGFRSGLYREIRAFPEAMPADLIAMQPGVSNLLGARSILPRRARAEVEAVPGVKVAHPLAGMPLIYTQGPRSAPVYILAYDTAGAPRRLVAGRHVEQKGEIVVDSVLARRFGLRSGDQVEFLGYRFTIVGLSTETTNPFNPYVFVRLVDLVDLYIAGDLPEDLPLDSALSFLLIELERGVDPEAVRAEIERRAPSVDVYTPAEVGESDARRARGFMGPALNLLVAVAYAGGTMVIALTLYVSVVARMREFGIMKAIGASQRRLGQEVVVEALIVLLAALGVAAAMATAVASLAGWAAPQYPVEPLEGQALLRSSVAGVAMACVGALFPIVWVRGVEPALVFRQGE
jgi:putative ABC transport system permease protein